jgi:hypothetical protein
VRFLVDDALRIECPDDLADVSRDMTHVAHPNAGATKFLSSIGDRIAQTATWRRGSRS